MIKPISLIALALQLSVAPGLPADPPVLLENESFQEKMQKITSERNDRTRLRYASELVAAHRVSSLQVKSICNRLGDDSARYEFALAAYPQIIDPENFYEVYDAFTSFSKVLRLHDQVRPFHRPGPGPGSPLPSPMPLVMTEADIKPVIQALRDESFDNTRTPLARQIISGSNKQFLADHVRRMMACFDFEPAKLELAKFAYDYTFDREKYFVVNEAFSFDNSKQQLAQYLETKTLPKPPKQNR